MKNSRFFNTLRYSTVMLVGFKEIEGSCPLLSLRNSLTANSISITITERIIKIKRQPSQATTSPPTVGAMIGAMPKTATRIDKTRAISLPENRSRTTALLLTIPTQAPKARSNRKTIKDSIDKERAHPTPATM
ncbi:MAG: hypothetical protein A4E57_04850 [Syntrophorhabdaceae bacterium PtaU1.Bin034]|nr:MAG: hypothetical protein A4E57_04850 [Syntrophorhabdaceae bacterium PtaU1.Bin034]